MGTKTKRPSKNRSESRVIADEQLPTQPAAARIAAAKAGRSTVPKLSAYAVKYLRELCEYNDGVSATLARVPREAASLDLKEHFGVDIGAHKALDTVCREQLGRKSWSQK